MKSLNDSVMESGMAQSLQEYEANQAKLRGEEINLDNSKVNFGGQEGANPPM
jgi:hypothetical protein